MTFQSIVCPELLEEDPKDDYLLALAREAGAEAIVTGDKDLLDHAEKLEPPAISPRAACELLKGRGKR